MSWVSWTSSSPYISDSGDGFEPSGQVQNEPQTELEQPVQDDARSRVAALDANSVSDIPQDVNEQLANILKNGSVKDSLAAKLNIMDQQK